MGNTYLAVDFGGGSGRIITGRITNGILSLNEEYRFPNRQIKLGKHVYWDFLYLFEEMKTGLRKAAKNNIKINSIGIDTWGVDFGLIDEKGNLIGNPICYRDSRTLGLPEELFKNEKEEKENYIKTGIQSNPINTIFQLYNLKKSKSKQLEIANKLLFMPDLFSFFLTGIATNEYTIASTSQLLNAQTHQWDFELINQLGIPEKIFGNILEPGSSRGLLLPEIAKETGLHDTEVIAVGSHDTASAATALPTLKSNSAFLSSGTWSLLGTLTDKPILTDKAREFGFTNEGGTGGKIRFLQNITGLWILQRLMEEWKHKGEEVEYDIILPQAEKVKNVSVIDPDHSCFTNPECMEKAITNYCKETNQFLPVSKPEIVRCILESLAARYKKGIMQMNECLEHPIHQLYIIGGGSRNKLLNQLTANYLSIPVYAGPVEATAMGNILLQALSKGEIKNTDELKEIAIKSSNLTVYYPQN